MPQTSQAKTIMATSNEFMKNTFVLLFTVLSALYYWQTSTAKDTEISVIPTAGRHIIISAKANGIEGRFIFGTGAETHLLTKTLTDKIDSLDKTHHFLAGHRVIARICK